MKSFQDFKNLLVKNYPKFFGLLYIYILVICLGIGLLYLANETQVTRKNIMPGAPDSTQINDLEIVEAQSIPPVNVMTLGKPTNELINQGKALFNKVCVSCHGEDGKGNGPGSTGLNPAPRIFTSLEGWKNGPKVSGIYKTLEEGSPGTAMVSFNYLTPSERFSLAHYIRQTFVPNPPQDNDDDLKTLDENYGLSKGKETPAQIPLASAMDIITNEHADKTQHFFIIMQSFEKDKSDGSKLLNRLLKHKESAFNWLAQNDLQSVYEFRSSVQRNVNINGFSTAINTLSADDWELLYNYYKKLFKKEQVFQ